MKKPESRIDFILKHSKGKVLHVGCGASFLHTILLHEFGERLHGLDIMDFSNVYPRFTKSDAEKMPFQDGLFDTILLPDVVMHVKNLQKVLSECGRVLKEDGILIVTAPNFNSIWNRLTGTYGDTWQKRIIKKVFSLGKPNPDWKTAYVYQRKTTMETLKLWLEIANFEIVATTYTFQGDDLGAAFVQEGINLQRGWIMDLRYLLNRIVNEQYQEELVFLCKKK